MALRGISVLILSLFISLSGAWAGNGSSGIGTASIAKGFKANHLAGSIERVGDEIIDLDTKEKILDVITIKKDEINFTKLAKAQFGKVNGFEYLPSSLKEKNYWIICKKNEKTCSKLIPTSSSNKKISSILGSLFEEDE